MASGASMWWSEHCPARPTCSGSSSAKRCSMRSPAARGAPSVGRSTPLRVRPCRLRPRRAAEMRDLALFILLIPRNLGVLLLRGYRAAISPLYGDVCRYYPSCSAYGLGSVQQRGLVVGSALAAWRILRCNPWTAGGIDDVRAAKHSRYRVTRFGWVIPAGWADSAASADLDAL